MPDHCIDLAAEVEAEREKSRRGARASFVRCLAIVEDAGRSLHVVEGDLLTELMALGAALMSLWLALRVSGSAPSTMTHHRSSYRLRGLAPDVVRTRFGTLTWRRPIYDVVHGKGPKQLSPADRAVELASGRMTLGVQLTAAYFAAKMPFDHVVDVFRQFAGYVPSKRTILGIVDKLGAHAATLLKDMPVPADDGDVLVIQNDVAHQRRTEAPTRLARDLPRGGPHGRTQDQGCSRSS